MSKSKKEKDNSLKIILGLLIIGVCLCLAYGGKMYLEDKKPVEAVIDNQQPNKVVAEDKKDEVKEENKEENKEEKEDTDKKEEQPEQPKQPESEEVSASAEDKAIELAKKEYGVTDGVYFRIEQTKSSDVYVVSVRDESTTAALEWYTVNISTGEVK